MALPLVFGMTMLQVALTILEVTLILVLALLIQASSQSMVGS